MPEYQRDVVQLWTLLSNFVFSFVKIFPTLFQVWFCNDLLSKYFKVLLKIRFTHQSCTLSVKSLCTAVCYSLFLAIFSIEPSNKFKLNLQGYCRISNDDWRPNVLNLSLKPFKFFLWKVAFYVELKNHLILELK